MQIRLNISTRRLKMDFFSILAQTAEQAPEKAGEAQIIPIELIWNQITNLGLIEALTFMSFGAMPLLRLANLQNSRNNRVFSGRIGNRLEDQQHRRRRK